VVPGSILEDASIFQNRSLNDETPPRPALDVDAIPDETAAAEVARVRGASADDGRAQRDHLRLRQALEKRVATRSQPHEHLVTSGVFSAVAGRRAVGLVRLATTTGVADDNDRLQMIPNYRISHRPIRALLFPAAGAGNYSRLLETRAGSRGLGESSSQDFEYSCSSSESLRLYKLVLKFDDFKSRLESSIFKCISWLIGLFFWGWIIGGDRGFLKEVLNKRRPIK
jgi:hypothetical protein